MAKEEKGNITKIQAMIFRGVFLVNIVLFCIFIFIIVFFVYKNIVSTTGELRKDLLKQVSDKGNKINKSASYVAKNLYNNLSYDLLLNDERNNDELRREIEEEFYNNKTSFDALGIKLSATIIMKNGFEYTSESTREEEINSIKNSFWYINNFGNEKNDLWVTRFGRFEDKDNMEVSYVKVLRDAERNYQGIIMISSLEMSIYSVYSDILNDNNEIYIIDENGIIISHKNKNLIGVHKFHMKTFFDEYKKDSYTIKEVAGKKVFFTNYHDKDTGWTIIEEYSFLSALGQYRNLLVISILSLFILAGINLLTSYYLSKRISGPIERFTIDLHNSKELGFEPMVVQEDYFEIQMMTIIFNKMVIRIKSLINRIKVEEKLKRKIQLDFLQAQINPHLLHNTLFSIKCLIELGKNDKALEMMEAFLRLLKAPINPDQQLIELREEIIYVRNYINLMEHRYENKISLEVDADEAYLDILVPRLIIQPIVENAIFHGLGDKEDDGVIGIIVRKQKQQMVITIKDNGVGITEEEFKNIWNKKENNKTSFNQIGLKNIKDRLNLFYGSDSNIFIKSEANKGTEVILTFSDTRSEKDEENNDC